MRRLADSRPRLSAALSMSLLLAMLMLLLATSARSEFTLATLLSGTSSLQFDSASSPALSEDGEYAAFRGSLAGVPGVYRRDLRTGEVALVAGEAPVDASTAEKLLSAPDASAPSISADGRYVVFTSAAVLDPQDEGSEEEDANGCPQVYVRDMDLTSTASGAYVLVSAVNGGSESLTYEKHCAAGSSTALAIGGAQAAAGVSLSADGQEVAFTVSSSSDLSGPCTGMPVKCPTEASQVAVRDLQTKTTTLVSLTPEGAPTPGGGAFPSAEEEQHTGSSQVATESQEPVASSAAISADGSTVAWQGTNVPAQVPPAADVVSGMSGRGGAALEVEPLWRRIADGSTAFTRRLLNEAGLNFYFGPSHESSQEVEGGALAPLGKVFVAPALSANGNTVATVANAPTATNEGSYQFIGYSGALPPAEAYAIQVDNDPTTPPRVTPLTATLDFAALNSILGGVSDVTISPDGSRVAFNTRRVSFALASPTLVSPPTQEVANAYTYVANLQLGTLQRVTSTYEGTPPDGEPGQLSFAGDDLSLAFASSASNLFYGDVTPGASQVYLTQEASSPNQVAPQSLSPPPLEALPTPAWLLSAIAIPQPDGSVTVDAYVPGAGKLAVRASAQLPSAAPHKSAKTKGGRPKAHKSKAGKTVQVSARTVGQLTAVAHGSSELRLRLRVSAAYRELVADKGGLYCVLDISFTAPDHAALRQEIPVTLRQVVRKRPAKGKAAYKSALAGRRVDGKVGSHGKTRVAQ
jgi:WD40-like Beta Propeller Repeat